MQLNYISQQRLLEKLRQVSQTCIELSSGTIPPFCQELLGFERKS